MNLKSSSINKTPAPGVQQQQQAEAVSKQRQQAQQAQQAAQAQAQAQTAAQNAYATMQINQYAQTPHGQPPVYNNNNNMYTPQQQPAPPPYPTQPASYGAQMGIMQPQGMGQMPQSQYNTPQSLYAQATTRAGRQRATTMDQQQGGIPPAIQRVASHLDPNAPIRLQPSPAYYPPPADGYQDANTANARRRGSRTGQNNNRGNRDFIRNLEDRTLEEGFMSQPQWH